MLQLGANWRPVADRSAPSGMNAYDGGPYRWGGLYAGVNIAGAVR